MIGVPIEFDRSQKPDVKMQCAKSTLNKNVSFYNSLCNCYTDMNVSRQTENYKQTSVTLSYH